MKTPEEIKKGMECCLLRWSDQHYASCRNNCPYRNEGLWCRNILMTDAKKLNERLESRLAQVERERDAAVDDLIDAGDCRYCKNLDLSDDCGCGNCCTCENEACPCCKCDRGNDHFEWRGVCSENTKEDSNATD